MKNKLSDLNNHLFEQIERLNDEYLKGDKLTQEINRAKAIANVSKNIIANGKLVLDAQKVQLEYGRTKFRPVPLLEQKDDIK